MNIYKQLKKKHFEDNVLSALDEFTSLNRKHSTNPEEFLVEARRWYSSKYDGQLDVSKDEAVGYLNESSLMKLERMAPGSKHSLKLAFFKAVHRFAPSKPANEEELMKAVKKILKAMSPSAMHLIWTLTGEDLQDILLSTNDFPTALSDKLLDVADYLTVDDLVDILDVHGKEMEKWESGAVQENQEQQTSQENPYLFAEDGNEIEEGYFKGFPDRLIKQIQTTITPVLQKYNGRPPFSSDLMTQPLVDIEYWTNLLIKNKAIEPSEKVKNWPLFKNYRNRSLETQFDVDDAVLILAREILKTIKKEPTLGPIVNNFNVKAFNEIATDPALDILTYIIAVVFLSRKYNMEYRDMPVGDDADQQSTPVSTENPYKFAADGKPLTYGFLKGYPDRLVKKIKTLITPVLNEYSGRSYLGENLLVDPFVDDDQWSFKDDDNEDVYLNPRERHEYKIERDSNQEDEINKYKQEICKKIDAILNKEPGFHSDLYRDIGYYDGEDTVPAIDWFTLHIAAQYLRDNYDDIKSSKDLP